MGLLGEAGAVHFDQSVIHIQVPDVRWGWIWCQCSRFKMFHVQVRHNGPTVPLVRSYFFSHYNTMALDMAMSIYQLISLVHTEISQQQLDCLLQYDIVAI